MTDKKDFVANVVEQALAFAGSGDFESLARFLREELHQSYKNGIARGKAEAERKHKTM